MAEDRILGAMLRTGGPYHWRNPLAYLDRDVAVVDGIRSGSYKTRIRSAAERATELSGPCYRAKIVNGKADWSQLEKIKED